jgi:hypothetical protein
MNIYDVQPMLDMVKDIIVRIAKARAVVADMATVVEKEQK